MALADIVLTDAAASPVNHTFAYTATDGNRVIRKDFSASPETPLTLTIAHNTSKRGSTLVDSHLVRLDKTVLDTDNVTPHAMNMRVCWDVPRVVLAEQDIKDMSAMLADFLAEAGRMFAVSQGSVG